MSTATARWGCVWVLHDVGVGMSVQGFDPVAEKNPEMGRRRSGGTKTTKLPGWADA